MEKSGSQKFLKVVSIIDIIVGILLLILGVMIIVSGTNPNQAELASLEASGVTSDEVAAYLQIARLAMVVSIVSGLINLIEGILGVRAANDPSKIMPVWILSLLGLIASAVTIIAGIAHINGLNFEPSQILSLALSILMFWVANNIKNQNAH